MFEFGSCSAAVHKGGDGMSHGKQCAHLDLNFGSCLLFVAGVTVHAVRHGLSARVVPNRLAPVQKPCSQLGLRGGLCVQEAAASRLADELPLVWQQRRVPRRFGKVMAGEVAECRKVGAPVSECARWDY
jgi:hypothetical protein